MKSSRVLPARLLISTGKTMKTNEFLDRLQAAGYWTERCQECRCTFDAPEGEDVCPTCEKEKEDSL